MGIIYRATLRKDGRSYIGKTMGSLKRRRGTHERGAGLSAPTPFSRALAEHGFDAFDWKILEKVPGEQIVAREAYYVMLYRSCERDHGFNTALEEEGIEPNKTSRSRPTGRRSRTFFEGLRDTHSNIIIPIEDAHMMYNGGASQERDFRSKCNEARDIQIDVGTVGPDGAFVRIPTPTRMTGATHIRPIPRAAPDVSGQERRLDVTLTEAEQDHIIGSLTDMRCGDFGPTTPEVRKELDALIKKLQRALGWATSV